MFAPALSEQALRKRARGYAETAIFEDFRKVRRRAFWRRVVSRIQSRPNHLPAMEEVLSGCKQGVQFDLGVRTVPVDRIVGSVDRRQDFDDLFMPRHEHLKDRWLDVNRAYYNDVALPAVELVQVGDRFFVVDGHHRISVARMHKQHFVDAHVVKIQASCAGDE